jgi:hypothetical protein
MKRWYPSMDWFDLPVVDQLDEIDVATKLKLQVDFLQCFKHKLEFRSLHDSWEVSQNG